MNQPTSTPTFPHQQAEKSTHNQHYLSILQVGSHHLQHRLFRTSKPRSRHTTNTLCPLTPQTRTDRSTSVWTRWRPPLNPTNADRPGRPDPRRRHGHTRSPGIPVESRGWERRRRDLNPRGAMHPYLLSREAHSTGLCDVSSADYSRLFSPRARTAPAASAQEAVGSAEGEGFEPPVPLLTQRFSRPSLSATQTALQTCLILQERAAQCRQRGHRRREAHDRKRTPRQAGGASVGSS